MLTSLTLVLVGSIATMLSGILIVRSCVSDFFNPEYLLKESSLASSLAQVLQRSALLSHVTDKLNVLLQLVYTGPWEVST